MLMDFLLGGELTLIFLGGLCTLMNAHLWLMVSLTRRISFIGVMITHMQPEKLSTSIAGQSTCGF